MPHGPWQVANIYCSGIPKWYYPLAIKTKRMLGLEFISCYFPKISSHRSTFPWDKRRLQCFASCQQHQIDPEEKPHSWNSLLHQVEWLWCPIYLEWATWVRQGLGLPEIMPVTLIQIKNISCSLNIHIYLVGEPAIQMCDDHGLTSDISSYSVPIQCPC